MREARPITTQNPSVGLYRFATAFPGHREHVALQRQPFASAWPCRYTPFRRLTSGHTPFRGFQNVREARPITTQNPSVGLYRFATAFPGHSKHVALQRQSFASAFPVAILHLEGFKTCAKHGRPITTQNPSVGLHRFATAFPGRREHVALQRQSFASAWPCRHTEFRGFQNVREARPIATQNPSVGVYRFATAFPGHREHVALQRLQGSPLPAPGQVAILHLEAFKTCAMHGPSRHKTPLWAFTALPLPSQVTANTLPCSGSPLPAPGHVAILHLEGFKTCAKHGPSRHKTPLWAFTPLPLPSQVTANTLPCSGSPLPAPGHVAILHLEGCHCLPRSPQTRCPAAAALCQRLASRHTPFGGFQNVREARPITTQNPSVGLYRLTTAFPGHREHVALQRQPFASAWPVAILHLEGFKTCAKHGPSRHKTPLWAFTALPLPSQITANRLPCSGSPLPAPGHVALLHLEGVKTCVKHGPSGHKTPLWAFTALPSLLSQVTANTLPCSASRLPAPWRCHVAIIHFLLSRFTPLPAHCQVTDLSLLGLVLPCVSEAPLGSLPCYPPFSFVTGPSRWHVAILHLEGFKTCAKHGPSRHKTPLWAFTALPLPSQVTANTLPCSGSPLPAPGLSPYFI